VSRWVPRLLVWIALGHSLLGLVLFREPLAAMLREGLVNTIGASGDSDREAAFWFLVFSAMLLLWGQLVAHASRRPDARALALVGWNMLLVGALGCLVMPVSGFWMVIALAPFVLRDGRRFRGEARA
jgi:hypothetical protein